MGWGDIAKELGVHPSFLGLGHYPKIAKSKAYSSAHFQMKSEIKAATARSYQGDSTKGHGLADSTSNGKDFGFLKTKHSGQKYNSDNKDRGLALGHSKDKSGGHGFGHGGGNGHVNGGGNSVGHGRGKK